MFVLLSMLTVGLFSASDVSATSTDNQSSYQTAFLYFLPEYQPKTDEAEVRGCAKLGYTYTRSNCAAPRILKDKCPVGNSYKTCYCAGSPTCTGSTSSSNPYPSSTGASFSSCVDCPGNTHYNWTCASSVCSAYTLSSCPANGYCSRCCSGKYKLDSCSSAYVVSGSSCICATTCSDTVTSKPTNSSYTTTSCTACDVTTTIKTGWACNFGYVKSGSSCICAKTCIDTVTSKPANSSYTTASCTACGTSKTIKTGWTCDSGYIQSGNLCVKICNIGDWVYSDLSRSENFDVSKTPIAMVFGSHEDKCYAMALNPINKSVFVPFTDVYNYDTGIYDYTKVNTSLPDLSYEEAFNDFNGRENTNVLTRELNRLADKVNSYSTAGTKAGDWFLGSAGETKMLINNYETLMAKLTAQGYSTGVRKQSNGTYLIQMWTSTEAQDFYAPMYSINIEGYKNVNDDCGIDGNLFILQTYYGAKGWGCWIGKDGHCSFENSIPSSNCQQGDFYPIINLNSL